MRHRRARVPQSLRRTALVAALACAGAAAGSGAGERGAATVLVKDGRLRVHVDRRPQDWILDEVSRQADIAIIRVDGTGPGRVSVQLDDLPVDEGLRWILGDQDAFFFYGGEKGRSVLRAVWIYPKGTGRRLEPVPPEAWASTRELERELADPDPAVRARAIEGVIARRRGGAREAVLDALKDQDDGVRARALYESLNGDVDLPAEVLGDLALGDPSPDVRFLALDALADDPRSRVVAEKAAGDTNLHVRQRAREILRRSEHGQEERKREERRR